MLAALPAEEISCHGPGRPRSDANRIRQDGAARPLVGAAPARVRRPLRVRGVRDLGRVPGRALHLRAVPLPLLLARAVRRLAPQLVRPQAALVAGLAALLARAPHPLGARRVPRDLLLLPRRVLQIVLGRPAVLRRGRATRLLPRRGFSAARPPERAPVLPVSSDPHPGGTRLRRVEGAVVSKPRRRNALRHRPGHPGPGRQRDSPGRVRPGLSLAAAPGGRAARSDLRLSPPQRGVRLLQLPQPPAHELGLVQPLQRGFRRPLRTALLHGRNPRLEDLLSLTSRYQAHEHDVLVIGAGGAGLRAAIEAAASGVSVGLVCKSLLGKAHTVMAEGGIAAALANVDDRDNWRVHFADTMRGGQYLNDWRMAELHAKEAPDRVRELEAWGALFDRTRDGRILQRNFGGHRYPRLAHVGDRTGLEMIRTLQDHGIHQGIDVHMEHTLTALLKDGERIAGAFGYDREKGLLHVFRARAVVLATGGIGKAYRITSNSWEYTGDGHALAYHAGAELMDMEFVHFHPTGMIWPPSVQGILVTEGVRGEGGVLLNKAGRRFLFDDIPEAYKNQTADSEDEGFRYTQGDKSARRPPELLTRDHVARCILREVREGRGSPHGGVFLDISWIKKKIPNAPEHIKRKLPSMYHQFKELGDIDITKEPMEVGPTTHYIMGGVRVDAESQMSRVPGLFACGECACGINGANRLGGNSLSDLVVFGKRAGEFAAKYARDQAAPALHDDQVEVATKWALEPF